MEAILRLISNSHVQNVGKYPVGGVEGRCFLFCLFCLFYFILFFLFFSLRVALMLFPLILFGSSSHRTSSNFSHPPLS
jgi:hypothetical protein